MVSNEFRKNLQGSSFIGREQRVLLSFPEFEAWLEFYRGVLESMSNETKLMHL